MATLHQKHAQWQVARAGLDPASRQLTGLSAADLTRHLRIASALLQGDRSLLRNGANRQWLHAQADRAGIDRTRVDAVIKQALAATDGEQAAAIYARAVGGNAQAAQTGLSLAKHYFRADITDTTEQRLRQADKAREHDQFRFADTPELKAAREDQGAVRRAIEAAAISSGAVAPPPRTFREVQLRAQAYGDAVADVVEATEAQRAAGRAPSLRDEVMLAVDMQDALAAKHNAGLSSEARIGDVIERTDLETSWATSALTERPHGDA